MLLTQITERLSRLQRTVLSREAVVRSLRAQIETAPLEGTTVGLKIAPALRAHLQDVQEKYQLSTYRETVLLCILTGAEALLPRITEDTQHAQHRR